MAGLEIVTANKQLSADDLVTAYRGKTVVVTGGAGFVGSNLCRTLLGLGNQVICIDNLVGSQGSTRNINDLESADFQFVRQSYEAWAVEAHLEEYGQVDCIFHQAASKNTVCMLNPELDLTVNAAGTLRLLGLAKKYGIRKFVHASTGSVYGPRVTVQNEDHPRNPASFYGNSKLAGETYCRLFGELYGQDYTIFRYFHVIGPYQDGSEYGGVVPIFIGRAMRGETLTIYGTGEQIRSFTSVTDVVQANILAAAHPDAAAKTYNCASGIRVSIQQLAEFIVSEFGGRSGIEHKDWRPGDIKYFDVDNSRLCQLGMIFNTNWQEVVREVIRWKLQSGM